MTYLNNVHPTPIVHDRTGHDQGDIYTESGLRIPAAEVRARAIADQAQRWLAFATERTRMQPRTLTAKVLQSTAFSVQRGAASFAVPSKLVGTSKHQRALWRIVQDPAEPWAALDLDATEGGLTASHDGAALGLVQSKHLGWINPLVPFGLTVHLARVTGHDYEAYTLGCNVVFGGVGTALDGLLTALGQSGDFGGDGAPDGPVAVSVAPVTPVVSQGDGAALAAGQDVQMAPTAISPLRLVVRPEHEALAATDVDDVVLYRRIDGTAHATCAHVVRHSPTGVDWGLGSGRAGRADLALSVLTRLVGADLADRHASAFDAQVVARIPRAGGLIRAAGVRDWVAAQADR